LVVGDPTGITDRNVGRVQNLRLRRWRRTHLLQALRDKAERAGIVVRLVDERGTSSTCPSCRRRVPKPRGREFRCPHCKFQGHRDLVGARNIAAKAGGGQSSVDLPTLVEHRRAGIVPARRDRRRHPPRPAAASVLPGLGPPRRACLLAWVSLAGYGTPIPGPARIKQRCRTGKRCLKGHRCWCGSKPIHPPDRAQHRMATSSDSSLRWRRGRRPTGCRASRRGHRLDREALHGAGCPQPFHQPVGVAEERPLLADLDCPCLHS
jgi:hypothetical protein